MNRNHIKRVHDLDTALQAYWNATSHREDHAAYHEILLFGGPNGYPSHGPWREWCIRTLRRLALWLERE
jgi:hypothetical protein